MGARQRKILYGVALSGVVALAAVIGFIALGGGGSGAASAAKTIEGQGCEYKHPKELARSPHYTSVEPKPAPKWNTDPPSSGRHYFQPVPFGIYTEPLDEIRVVHNLEHGGMVLQYGDQVPQAMVDQIESWYRDDPNAVVVAPYPKLGDKVALTAWTQWAECTGFDKKAADAFRDAFRYKAPEKFPKDSLDPGE